MSEMKHTPGPWGQAHRKGLGGGYRTQVYPANDPDNTIATLHWHSVTTEKGYKTDREANAHLIAAAPELLEALESIVSVWDGPKYKHFMSAHIDRARAAIAKAKGDV